VTGESDLVQLLRKCHRDELEVLARLLRIEPRGMKLGTLARAIDKGLRRAGINELLTIARWGDPPPYPVVLRQIAIRLGLPPAHSVVANEIAIVRHHLRKAWSLMTPEERASRWAGADVHGLRPPGGPTPTGADEAMRLLEARHPRSVGLFLTHLVTKPPLPLPGCLLLLWLARPRDDLAVPAVIEVCRLRHTIRHRVTVGIVGSPSSGKDAALAAIFGFETGNVDPVAGSTKEVEIRRLPASTALWVVNTPGMGDVIESVTEEAREVLDHIDVYLYLVNAQGGVQARELADYAACRQRRRPVLVVVNKVDTLRPDDRERFVEDCRRKLGVDAQDLVAAAFDPLPQLAETPIGVEAVRAWIEARLEGLGKDRAELPWVDQVPVPLVEAVAEPC
jgi:hypothetical protein